ncbi:MAG: transcription termination factor Rho [Butyrivibrio sp.]|nr:transcription termination factor Rho [Butyrivibrio sp.]
MKEKLQTLSLAVLRDIAKDKKIKNITVMRKSQLIDAIIAAAEADGSAKQTPRTITHRQDAHGETEARGGGEAPRRTSETAARQSETPARQTENQPRQAESVPARTSESAPSRTSEGTGRPSLTATFGAADDPYRQDYDPNMVDAGADANGILEVMPDGYGFIRCANYMPGENDVYVSPAQIKRFGLKTGDIIVGAKRLKNQGEKFSALLFMKSVNGYNPSDIPKRKAFEKLTPIFPDDRIHLATSSSSMAMRIMDLISPIGKGQRGMIVSPPKAGKTTLLKQVAKSITANHRDMHLIILLIDERPEEVTDIKESIEGDNVEVIYSTFDELPEHHKRVSEMVIERARRLVEHRQDVCILLDSITRLTRAYNIVIAPSGRTLSGGLDPASLHMPKKFFGAARNMREGGSLTILATALVDTGSKMDDVVFEEFKGTGNMEIVLDRKLSEKRIFPAIDIVKSGTRREDLLLTREEREAVDIMRKALNGMRSDDAVERIIDMFSRTRSNAELCQIVKKTRIV